MVGACELTKLLFKDPGLTFTHSNTDIATIDHCKDRFAWMITLKDDTRFLAGHRDNQTGRLEDRYYCRIAPMSITRGVALSLGLPLDMIKANHTIVFDPGPLPQVGEQPLDDQVSWGGPELEATRFDGLDPHGIHQHAPGAKLDAGKNRLHLVLSGFGNALEAVGRIGTYGANKYSDNGWMSVPNGRQRYADALLRHLLAESKAGGSAEDEESGFPHLAHAAWNALALLELSLREKGVKE